MLLGVHASWAQDSRSPSGRVWAAGGWSFPICAEKAQSPSKRSGVGLEVGLPYMEEVPKTHGPQEGDQSQGTF